VKVFFQRADGKTRGSERNGRIVPWWYGLT